MIDLVFFALFLLVLLAGYFIVNIGRQAQRLMAKMEQKIDEANTK